MKAIQITSTTISVKKPISKSATTASFVVTNAVPIVVMTKAQPGASSAKIRNDACNVVLLTLPSIILKTDGLAKAAIIHSVSSAPWSSILILLVKRKPKQLTRS